LGFVITPETASPSNSAVDGIKPFSSASEIGSNYYRIPAVITAADGTLVASADARFGGTKDSANNIDTAVSLSHDGGESWSEPTLA
ncbi:sialidase family protein, partial [Acinetobacter baumannii]|nr:sialidase family protein [Acinetobacter baumannii]